MNLLTTIESDYKKFPQEQTYSIYAEDVHFRDPVYNFRGIDQYRKMIRFITTWFADLKLDLHSINQIDRVIKTEWTMSWYAPLPWKPRISVSGWTELHLNDREQISAHYDYWYCSRWDVIRQHFQTQRSEL